MNQQVTAPIKYKYNTMPLNQPQLLWPVFFFQRTFFSGEHDNWYTKFYTRKPKWHEPRFNFTVDRPKRCVVVDRDIVTIFLILPRVRPVLMTDDITHHAPNRTFRFLIFHQDERRPSTQSNRRPTFGILNRTQRRKNDRLDGHVHLHR